MKLKAVLLLTILLLISSVIARAQVQEKLDSLTRYDYAIEQFDLKTIYQYDEQGRDTTIQDYTYVAVVEGLALSRTLRIHFATNQIITEVRADASQQLTSRVTVTLDDRGQELESLMEVLNPTSRELEPSTKFVTITFNDERWDRQQLNWNGSEFILVGRELTVYQPAGGYIQTTFTLMGNDFVPDQRTTQLFDAATGVETFYLIENYFALSDLWAPFLRIETRLNETALTAAKVTDLSDFDTGELERFDSTAIYFNSDWTPAWEMSYRPRGAAANYVLIREEQHVYTPFGNLAISDIYLPTAAGDTLELAQTDTYYYSERNIASTQVPTEDKFPVELVFQNPTVTPVICVRGEAAGTEYTLRLHDLAGRTLRQQVVTAGETISLSAPHLSSGWYLLTLASQGQAKVWKLLVL